MLAKKLLQISKSFTVNQRSIAKFRYNWYNEGIQYPGFKYYPRHENFKDNPYEPSKLFRISRLTPLKGLSKWEKDILQGFGLLGKKNDYAIVKNIPENNARLWKVKHLVEILPITFPDGFPKESDRTYLTERGQLRIIKTIQPIEKQLQLTEEFSKLPERMDGDTLRRNLRRKWNTGYESVL
ncbi:mitochondrial ribosomal protein L30 [Rhynchophorus ferrugineus]|uniref:mitochondrial ribosomal protein L30 n=1 Tax=Rhynchophorus ferrugineus TaxID=354439 RepID=UPI003FCD7AFB